ncbi:MAG: alpha-E domain-containing protein, partial [Verrucomicrobia bacterium]|nr:alpha-E domain-containing protein [Verrucomicrobiota bacterium]
RADFQYKVEAERLSGKLLADLRYITTKEIFDFGLHEYLDKMQLRLIEINNAIYKEFCEWLDEDSQAPEPGVEQLQEQIN